MTTPVYFTLKYIDKQLVPGVLNKGVSVFYENTATVNKFGQPQLLIINIIHSVSEFKHTAVGSFYMLLTCSQMEAMTILRDKKERLIVLIGSQYSVLDGEILYGEDTNKRLRETYLKVRISVGKVVDVQMHIVK